MPWPTRWLIRLAIVWVLPGAWRPLHGDAAVLGQPPGHRLLLGVGRQRHQQPLGRLPPGTVLARAVVEIQPARLVRHHRRQRRGHLDLLRHQRIAQAREEPPEHRAAPADQQHPARRDRRRGRRRTRAVVPSATWPSSPSGASSCSYRWRHRSSNGPTGSARNLLTKVDQQVEPLHVQALKQVDLQVRDQGLGLARRWRPCRRRRTAEPAWSPWDERSASRRRSSSRCRGPTPARSAPTRAAAAAAGRTDPHTASAPCSASPRRRHPGPPGTLHVAAQESPEPFGLLRVIGELVVEIQRRTPVPVSGSVTPVRR